MKFTKEKVKSNHNENWVLRWTVHDLAQMRKQKTQCSVLIRIQCREQVLFYMDCKDQLRLDHELLNVKVRWRWKKKLRD